MTDSPFTGKAFQAAVDRRLGAPLRIERMIWQQDWDDPGDEGRWVTVVFRIDPNTDMIRLGMAMGAMGTAMSGVGESDDEVETRLAKLDQALPVVSKALRQCVVPPDRAAFDDVSAALGVKGLSEVIQQVMGAMSGMDPTRQASLPDGSPPTSLTSTDGAPPGA